MSRRSKKARLGAAVPRFNLSVASSGKCGWHFVLFLVATTLIAYLPVWHAGFLWDDDILLTANPLIKDPQGWWRFWVTTRTPDYFPVMSSAFWLEWRLWGMNATGYHVTNVLLHASSAILLWRVLLRLNVPGAWLAAAIFALHPVNVASVAWIAELKNTLSFFFFALSLLSYLKFDDANQRRWYWISIGAFVLALLSKTAAAPLPFVLIGIAWWRRGRVEWKDVWRSAAFFAVAGSLALITIWFQYHNAIRHDIVRTDSFWSRLAVAGRAVWFYFYKALFPVNLIPIYPRWNIGAVTMISFVPGLLLAAGFFVCWLYRAKWGKPFLFGLGYAVVMLLPVLGFLNISFFRYSLVADHYQYFAIVGIIALTAAGITKALNPFPKGKMAFCGALLLLLAVLTWKQADVYRDAQTLWRTTLTGNPDSWLAHNNLGDALFQKGNVDDAIVQFQQALQINPGYAQAHNNFGNALLQKKNVNGAIVQFQQALQINPDYADAHYNLGNALLQKGNVDGAIAQFQQALQIKPDYAEAYNNLGNALLQKGNVDEAIVHYQQALQIKPDDAEAYNNFGNALLQKGNVDEAIAHYQQALQIKPDYAEAHNNLGNALLQKGNVDEAIAHYQQALQINPDYAKACYNLGNALLQKGNVDEAIPHFRKALEINPDYAEAHNNLGEVLFQKGKADEAVIHLQKALELARAAGREDIVERLTAELKQLQGATPIPSGK